MSTVIVGQEILLDRLIIGLLADGHVLVEGLPVLAKTTAVKTLAAAIHGSFRRIQFTLGWLNWTSLLYWHKGRHGAVPGSVPWGGRVLVSGAMT